MLKLLSLHRLLCVWALLLIPAIASAHSPVHPETRVGDFEVAAKACVRLSVLANSSGHQANDDASTAEAVGYPHATKGAPKLLTQGAYRATGFAKGQLDNHFAKHAAEWGAGNITKVGYLKRAENLLGREVGGNIHGAVRANGDVLRYNAATNEFAVGAGNGTIRTLFRPSGGMSYWQSVTGGL